MKGNLALLILWIIVGIITLLSDDISHISYACVWVVLLVQYVMKIIEGRG